MSDKVRPFSFAFSGTNSTRVYYVKKKSTRKTFSYVNNIISKVAFAVVNKGLTDKLLHNLKQIKVSYDKTQFRLLIEPKDSKGKRRQLESNPIKDINAPTSLWVSSARHSAKRMS